MRLLRLHRLHQRSRSQDIHDASEVIGKHVQRHFGAHVPERFHSKVSGAHPRLDGPEGVLDGLPALAHGLRVLVEPPLDIFEKVFVFPAGDATLFSCGAFVFDGASLARVGPVAA